MLLKNMSLSKIAFRHACLYLDMSWKNKFPFLDMLVVLDGRIAQHGHFLRCRCSINGNCSLSFIVAANEALLIHGTKPEVAQKIAEQGFDEPLSRRTLYGRGAYFTDEVDQRRLPLAHGRTLRLYLFIWLCSSEVMENATNRRLMEQEAPTSFVRLFFVDSIEWKLNLACAHALTLDVRTLRNVGLNLSICEVRWPGPNIAPNAFEPPGSQKVWMV